MNLIIFALLFNKFLFVHAHILNDGSIVMHSHPYSESKENTSGKHTHNTFDLVIIASLDNFFSNDINIEFSDTFIHLFNQKALINFNYNLDYYFNKQGRAPPII